MKTAKGTTMKTTILTLKGLSYNEARENEARETLERLRWPGGVACPRCGSTDVAKLEAGKKIRKGLYRCKDCQVRGELCRLTEYP